MNDGLPRENSRAERLLGLGCLLALAASLLLALFGRRMPAPLAADAALELFAAGRARAHLDEIARAPHPVGSAEHARVLQHVLGALGVLGLEPELQAGEVGGVRLTNVLARIPGTSPTGTVLCLAHHDSVASGPGAGDDGIGVVSWLEALRALRARGWKPRNDVLLLLTDGEERGLLGAILFSEEHPAASDVRVAINLEAIGNGGPAVLFETGPGNAALVREFARAIRAPAGTSLGDAVYRRMPNDTDLTVFLRRGIPGYNLAITAGSTAYHAPHDTPANLDPASVQHMGECALALVERLGELDLATLAGADATYFDLAGYGLVRYPAAWDRGLAGLGVLAVLGTIAGALRRGRLTGRELFRWLARYPLEGALVAAIAWTLWWLIDQGVAALAPAPSWPPGNFTSGVLLLAGLVALVAGLESAREARSEPPAGRALAALLWWSLAALAAASWLPGASFALSWPVWLALPSVLLSLAAKPLAGLARLVPVLSLALPLAIVLPIVHLLVQLFQRNLAPAVCLTSGVLALGAGLFGPQVRAIAKLGKPVTLALLLTGLAGLIGSSVIAHILAWRQGSFCP